MVIAMLFCLVPAQMLAGTLLVNQVTPYLGYGYGLGYWTGMTGGLNTAFGAGNVTVSASPLTNLGYMLGFDRLWITARQPFGQSLSATEIANLAAFIATGRRVVLTGENSAWTAWNNSILSAVGGSYLGPDTSATLTPSVAHPVTAGITALNTAADGIATGGTSLFSQNVVTLWGANVISLLSVNVIDDTNGAGPGNTLFKSNLANWLAGGGGAGIPEPTTWLLVGAGLTLLGTIRRRARR
ncbi:MAG: PEP-CTERM sorting domain-containing protein [Acidobacteriota bacterium]